MRKITRDETDKKRVQQLWISVKDRLPDDYGAVLITWVNRNPERYYAHIKDTPFVGVAHFYPKTKRWYWYSAVTEDYLFVGVAHFYPKTKRWYWYSAVTEDYLSEYGDSEFDRIDKDIDITHWMPLPEPPVVFAIKEDDT